MIARGPATVLIVDDEPAVADAFASELEDEYIVTTAYSGREALDKLDASVDVVLLDRRMPDISGDQVLDHVRDRRLNCRVAMVTAVDPDFDIIEMPFDDYVIKPVDPDELVATIQRLDTTATYEEHFQEYYALAAKHAVLSANKSDAELTESEQFRRLEDRLEAVRHELDRAIERFDDEDFATAFRDIDGQPIHPIER